MAHSTFSQSSRGCRIAQLFSAVAVGLFLGMTYLVVEQEIRASDQTYDGPANVTPSEDSQETPSVGAPQATKPEAKPAKRREGSRREWYERRKRRWTTPPQIDTDRGLPKQRRFKLS